MLLPLELFVMLVLANGSPVVAARLFGRLGNWPVDAGRPWRDGRPLFGRSKTWRGLLAGILACSLFSVCIGLEWLFGALFGLLALMGDLLSSFVKRRLGLKSSARALGLDQVPESLLPMLLAWYVLPIPGWQALSVAALFALSNILVSPLLYRLGIRSHPH
ncbi:CDP-archaeol synthase [Marinobacter nauticus]